jgi:catalase
MRMHTAGGELHQVAGGDAQTLTTQQGVPVADGQNTLKQVARGPALLEDFHFREKIFHFDHERIPERVVHARGYAAHGFSRPVCACAFGSVKAPWMPMRNNKLLSTTTDFS